jgi:hypothetical protein
MTLPTAFHLLIGDVWVALEDVDADIPVESSRPTSEFVSSDGTRFVRRAKRLARSWRLSYSLSDESYGRWLKYASSGDAGEVWLLDTAAAQVNMLDPRMTKGSLAAATLIAVDGGPKLKAFAAGDTYTRKVRAGVTYYLSYTTTHTAATTIGTYNAGAGSVNITSPAGSGARRGVTSFTPAADADVTITWTVANKTTAARLTEGDVDDGGFLEGRNTPCRVSVSDPSVSMDQAFDDRLARTDTTYLLREVG